LWGEGGENDVKRNSNQLFFNRIKILTPNPCSNAAILSPSLSQQASRSKEEKTLTWCPAPPLQGSAGSDKGEGGLEAGGFVGGDLTWRTRSVAGPKDGLPIAATAQEHLQLFV